MSYVLLPTLGGTGRTILTEMNIKFQSPAQMDLVLVEIVTKERYDKVWSQPVLGHGHSGRNTVGNQDAVNVPREK